MMTTQPSISFKGITRYTGELYKIENRFRTLDNEDRLYVEGHKTSGSLTTSQGVVLTDNDMFHFLKESYDISIPEANQSQKSAQAFYQALTNGTTPEASEALRKLQALQSQVQSGEWDNKVLAYADAREALGSDIDGQPVLNLTI